MYSLGDYDYHLPTTLIAQSPMARRTSSRLLCLDRASRRLAHRRFEELADLLRPGDVLVLNDTKVVAGRLVGRKASGGRVEVLLLDYAQGVKSGKFECLLRASKRPKAGSRLFFGQGVEAQVESINDATGVLSFQGAASIEAALESIGCLPLPPYIQREEAPGDRAAYQTVYARTKGAVAAPTAGLHFSRALLDQLEHKGVCIACLTLHVGYGTFVPVRKEDIRYHAMHAEWYTLPADAAEIINSAKSKGGRVVAVGTTSVRTLEYCAHGNGRVAARSGMCDLFIYPGYTFKMVDAMITNFHLPRSTLLMLVSAFAGRERILDLYAEAVRERYRFYSYGDAMVIF